MSLQVGHIKWYLAHKGFGFITPIDGGNEIFVNRLSLADSESKIVEAGQKVEFYLQRSYLGPIARDVLRV